MKPEEIEFEDQLIRNWWEDMLNGSKPASIFNAQWEVTEDDLTKAREKGLEIISYQAGGKSEVEPDVEEVCVAQLGSFRDLVSGEKLKRFRDLGLGNRMDKVLAEIGDKSIGQAVVFLERYERKDDEYDLGPYNAERPEIAALTGMGLGYPDCDVEYYIRTNYLGEESDSNEQVDPRWGHGLCAEHSQAGMQRKRQQSGG